MADTLTTKKYWTQQISGFKPYDVTDNDFSSILEKYLPVDPSFSCVEVGAYPGTNLCYLAKRFKYKPTAIEYRDDVEDIEKLLEFNGISKVDIINKSFLEVKDIQFDVVTSFGFIEHFKDYESIIRLHKEMVKPGGFLVLSVPHFWGFQKLIRRLLFKQEAVEEIVQTHNLEIMNLAEMRRCLKSLNVKILYSGYTLGAQFWIPSDSTKIRNERRWLAKVMERLNGPLLQRMPSCFLYSPMILCVAKIDGA